MIGSFLKDHRVTIVTLQQRKMVGGNPCSQWEVDAHSAVMGSVGHGLERTRRL